MLWRSAVGLRDIEIVIRRSRSWDAEVLVPGVDVVEPDGAARRRFDEEVRKATSDAAMREKTGYMLLNSAWDLDWAAMVFAQQMVDAGDASLADFRTKAYLSFFDAQPFLDSARNALDSRIQSGNFARPIHA